MKDRLLFLMLLLITGSAFSQTNTASKKTGGPIITFKTDSINMGTIKNGADCAFYYPFTNTGNEPLIISEVQMQTGAHVASWPKEPILPGQAGIIKVSYDSHRTGKTVKRVVVISNAVNEPKKPLYHGVNVLAPEDTAPPQNPPRN